MQELEVTVASNHRAPRVAREAIDRVTAGLPASLRENARLLVSELVTNSVRHAGLEHDAWIELRARTSEAGLRVEVLDAGPGFEHEPAHPSMYRTSGWGLYLVEQIADRWGKLPGPRSTVWFELDLDDTRRQTMAASSRATRSTSSSVL
jgi:anti-sigma regulatory factor (Ser/Thr protein kinase)